MAKFALFIVLFASLAPSVSHALATYTGNAAFAQTICTTNGDVVVIEVVTTKGQQIKTELTVNQNSSEPASKHVDINLIHCPFCAAGGADFSIAAPNHADSIRLAQQDAVAPLVTAVTLQSATIQTAHQTRAPPALL